MYSTAKVYTGTKTQFKIIGFLGSVRENRMGERVAKYVQKFFAEKTNHRFELFDPKELQLPMLVQPYHFYPDPSKAPKQIQDLNERIKSADAYVVITAEYNRHLPPALTNLMDHFHCYDYKPAAIVSYSMGMTGGISAAIQARGLLVELGSSPVQIMVNIPTVQNAIDEDGTLKEERVEKNLAKMILQLEYMAEAFKTQREVHGLPQ